MWNYWYIEFLIIFYNLYRPHCWILCSLCNTESCQSCTAINRENIVPRGSGWKPTVYPYVLCLIYEWSTKVLLFLFLIVVLETLQELGYFSRIFCLISHLSLLFVHVFFWAKENSWHGRMFSLDLCSFYPLSFWPLKFTISHKNVRLENISIQAVCSGNMARTNFLTYIYQTIMFVYVHLFGSFPILIYLFQRLLRGKKWKVTMIYYSL